uniref:Helitron helicase-like domain-containing protein n=1 Tax=Noccaea caerulescens TaxID=107243 RepID=A0A1J3EVC3_NOCCA
MPGQEPRFLQLYIVDTANEVTNRIKNLSQTTSSGPLQESIVKQLIDMLDSNNHLCQIFRKARDRYENNGTEEFTIRLIAQQGKGKQYDLPDTNEVAGLIVGDMSTTTGYKDVILQFQSSHLQEIKDDHPLYMSLQYPVLFPFGEYGYHTEIPYVIASSFTGSPRYMIEKYHDAMAIFFLSLQRCTQLNSKSVDCHMRTCCFGWTVLREFQQCRR